MDTIFANLAIGFDAAVTANNILWMFIGGFLGTVMGMLPGLGPATGVAILIPITYNMEPTMALITMCAVYYGAMFGGSRASIMINTPGDASAIVSCFDGYPMTKQGKAGEALAISAIASFIGGTIGMIMLIVLTGPIADYALKFGPVEMFALLMFALTATITLSEGSLLKGCVAICTGFMLSSIGIDPQTGVKRFTLGIEDLQEGIDFLVVMIGIYAVCEVFKNLKTVNVEHKLDSKSIGKVWVSKERFMRCLMPMLRNSPLGFLIGVLPGMGGTIATFMSYAVEKSISKTPENFGKGEIVGLAAPEASNNACSCGAMVPLLTLGIPGSGVTAVMLGALMMLGVRPGPVLFAQQPEIAWGVITSMVVSNVMLLIINLPLAVPLVQLLRIPQRVMMPLILGMAFMGSYFLNYSPFDFVLLVVFAVLGFLCGKVGIPLPPLVLALILGESTEQYFRNAMTMSNGSFAIFVEKPISAVLFVMAALFLVYAIIRNKRHVKLVTVEH